LEKILISKLNKFGVDGVKLLLIIKKYKLALFGSFLLQVISNE